MLWGLDFCNLGTSCTFYKHSGSDRKESTSYAGDLDSIPGEGNGYPLQYFYLKHSINREAWTEKSMGL